MSNEFYPKDLEDMQLVIEVRSILDLIRKKGLDSLSEDQKKVLQYGLDNNEFTSADRVQHSPIMKMIEIARQHFSY